jgi:hypothetical protein
MKPTEQMIEALDHLSEVNAGHLSRNLRDMLLLFLTIKDVAGNDCFDSLMRDLYQVFYLLDTIEEEQLKNLLEQKKK